MLKNYLSVTKKEWNGLVVLMLLIVLVWLIPYFYRYFHKDKQISLNGFYAKAAQLGQPAADTIAANMHLFAFNPNHLPDTAWLRLGLTEGQVKMIKNYEAKGGRFYRKRDLKKIYAITQPDYDRLFPYINLPDNDAYTEKPAAVVELNTADSAGLTRVRGIGPGFARIILRYRDRLGGFYKKEQLLEIYHLDSITYRDIAPQLRVDASRISKININTVAPNATNLEIFPYLSYKQKNAVVEYRNQHGAYTSLSDLKNIPIIDNETLKKIAPYISLK